MILNVQLIKIFSVLSDPSSVCLNASSLSPYNPLTEPTNQTIDYNIDETNCNACVCVNGQPRCSNLWCGLPNCLAPPKSGKTHGNSCEIHQVKLKEMFIDKNYKFISFFFVLLAFFKGLCSSTTRKLSFATV